MLANLKALALSIWQSILGPTPKSLEALSLLPRVRRKSSTENIYVLRVQHPVTQEYAATIEARFRRLYETYGIEIIVLEPGVTLIKLDDL